MGINERESERKGEEEEEEGGTKTSSEKNILSHVLGRERRKSDKFVWIGQ